MTCEKKRLKSPGEAKAIIKSKISKGTRMRSYYCKYCKAYHVTKTTRDGITRAKTWRQKRQRQWDRH